MLMEADPSLLPFGDLRAALHKLAVGQEVQWPGPDGSISGGNVLVEMVKHDLNSVVLDTGFVGDALAVYSADNNDQHTLDVLVHALGGWVRDGIPPLHLSTEESWASLKDAVDCETTRRNGIPVGFPGDRETLFGPAAVEAV
jgi:hypothetical protein